MVLPLERIETKDSVTQLKVRELEEEHEAGLYDAISSRSRVCLQDTPKIGIIAKEKE